MRQTYARYALIFGYIFQFLFNIDALNGLREALEIIFELSLPTGFQVSGPWQLFDASCNKLHGGFHTHARRSAIPRGLKINGKLLRLLIARLQLAVYSAAIE